ncbi:hypothetical protein OEZ85_003538 [Tetradesmus obliquus]|uniref:Dirigent protein n=1 Tax=Tetradesmus obliquus TaxID=3088 RepID=A0ABY8UBL9_TETOB|nr:hypothetical protein OEZ85_003538 [Tetradesmus obliquus]
MARYVLAILAAAVLCTAVLAQDVTPAHKGGHDDSETKYSVYDSNSQRYRPVKCGKNLCLYRIHVKLHVDFYKRSQPTPATFATTVGVYTGTVLDYATNATAGTFEVAGIATNQPAGPTDNLNVQETHVFEFGPERDDALTATGNSQVSPVTGEFADYDTAVTGGTGQFLGAYGSLVNAPSTVRGSDLTEATLTVYVPSNKL